ncbi:MAG: 4-demethylwyosine synthase TYW1 [archaeon]
MNSELKDLLTSQQYRVVGNHAAVKICHWTKESLRNKGFCYKQQFYGVDSHRCLQMTPCADVCNQRCVYCWRPMEGSLNSFPTAEIDEPDEMIDRLIEQQRALIMGFKGHSEIDMKKFEEALEPKHAAISLSGEPTLYPKLGGLIESFHKRGLTTFLVTNGTRPDVLESIPEPTQLYISLDAPNEEMYKKIDNPQISEGWKAIQKSLEMLKSFSCRTVIRLTLMRRNMVQASDFGKLLDAVDPTCIEAKAYMHVGASQDRLPHSEMPLHSEIKAFSEELKNNTGFKILDEKPESRVVLLGKR